MTAEITIRAFVERDAAAVRELFIAVNRLLSPPHLREVFEHYINRSLAEEIDRIIEYYEARQGGFWVALREEQVVGTFGLEATAGEAMELRRMYVDPTCRRAGIARRMLRYAECECRRRGHLKLELSTSELQSAALALYRSAGYRQVREEIAGSSSNKTIGGGIRRFHFERILAECYT